MAPLSRAVNAVDAAAQALCRARTEGRRIPAGALEPADVAQAYAIQDATLARIGSVGGWKVAARAPGLEPTCAPLPAACLLPDGAVLRGAGWRLRGIELGVGFLLGADLPARAVPYTPGELAALVGAVLPVIEVVETRLVDWLGAEPLAQLADLLSHGTLVLGAPRPIDAAWFDLAQVKAELHFDDQPVARTVGEHPSPDAAFLLSWLANHAADRGLPLRSGQLVTTGSCTGLLFASEGCSVRGEVAGLLPIGLQF